MLDITSAPTTKRVPCHARTFTNPPPRRRQGVGEAGAGRAEIEAPRPRRADFVLQQAGPLGKIASGVVVPTTMTSMSVGLSSPACAHGGASGLRGEVRGGDARIDDVTLADARSAAGSTRRWCRPSSRGRRSTTPSAARRSDSPEIFTCLSVFTTDDPFPACPARNIRRLSPSPRARVASDRETRSG